MAATRGQKTLHFLLGFMPLRLAWAACGAYAGLAVFVGVMTLSSMVPSHPLRWLDRIEIPAGSAGVLPLGAFVWLGFAGVGAFGFTRVWSVALARVSQSSAKANEH